MSEGERHEARRRERERAAAAAKQSADASARDERPDPIKEVLPARGSERWLNARIVGRVLLFMALVAVPYLLLQQVTVALFSPRLEVVEVLLPQSTVSPNAPIRVGVRVRNERPMEGIAFVMAALADGSLIEGPSVEVPGNGTAEATVSLELPAGEHVFSMILFDGFRGVQRLRTWSGVRVTVGNRVVALEGLALERDIASLGDTVGLTVTVTNEGYRTETVVPVVRFDPVEGGAAVAASDAVFEVEPGMTAEVRLRLETAELTPGIFFTSVELVTDDGLTIGRSLFPVALEVVQPDSIRR